MRQSNKEIIAILHLYTIAKIKDAEIKETFSYSKIKECRKLSLYNDCKFYMYIVNKVEYWLKNLFEDEKELIYLRFFKDMKYQQIAPKLNYSNHSCLIKK